MTTTHTEAEGTGELTSRRSVLKKLTLGAGGLAGLTGLGAFLIPGKTWAEEFAMPDKVWTEADLNAFLGSVNPQEGEALMASSEKKGTPFTDDAIRARLNWLRYHTFDPRAHYSDEVDYHEIVCWAAKLQAGVDEDLVSSASTFELERMLTEHSIATTWEGLGTDQRVEVLQEVAADGTPDDGSELLDLLGKYQARNQRKYYENLLHTAEGCYYGGKSLMKRSPGFAGTLATRIQSLNIHPVLWATAVLIALASVGYILGRASPRKASVVISQMHLIKVAALEDAGVLDGIIGNLQVS